MTIWFYLDSTRHFEIKYTKQGYSSDTFVFVTAVFLRLFLKWGLSKIRVILISKRSLSNNDLYISYGQCLGEEHSILKRCVQISNLEDLDWGMSVRALSKGMELLLLLLIWIQTFSSFVNKAIFTQVRKLLVKW